MFSQIRKRLTILYSSMLILIFILFIVIIYFVMSAVIYDVQKKELNQFVYSEMDHYEGHLKRGNKEEELKKLRKREKEESEEKEEYKYKRRYFYYLVDNNGKVINDKAVPAELRDDLFKTLANWTPLEKEYRQEILEVDGDERHLFFSIILAIAGYYMAGRAIIPAQQAYEKQKQFVADASHELRTPLAVVYSSLEILEKDEKEKLSSFAKQMLDDLKIEVQLMTKLVSDLLLLARTDLNKIQLQYTTFDLAEIMPQIVRAFQPILSNEQIIELNTPEQLMIEGDRERIIQLLHILMDNAVKYTPKGKILLSIEQEKGKRAGHVIIRVQDEGIGISEPEQKRIFDRFYRVDKARSREMGGTGLGLSIAKSIVDAHHGRIMVESKLGEGTTMTVSLPVRKK